MSRNYEIDSIIIPFISVDKPPIDLDGIINSIENLSVMQGNLPHNVSGTIEKKRNKYIITINQSHSEVRQRFTLAHELAHYFLHRDNLDDVYDNDFPNLEIEDFDDSYFEGFDENMSLFEFSKKTRFLPSMENHSSNMEIEANKLAVKILMPLSLVKMQYQEIISKNTNIDSEIIIEQLADRFKVSTQAMSIRVGYL